MALYTKQELCNAVYYAVDRAGIALTRLEICRAIGRAKSPHIVAMIEALAEGGWLVKVADCDRYGRPAFRYKVGAVPDCEAIA